MSNSLHLTLVQNEQQLVLELFSLLSAAQQKKVNVLSLSEILLYCVTPCVNSINSWDVYTIGW